MPTPIDPMMHFRPTKLKPDYAEAWYGLGWAYDKSGRKEEAEAAFAEARKLKPELFKK